jgi:hypothetical protein
VASSQGFGAPCCGGGASIPSLILSDDRQIFGLSYSYASVIGESLANGDSIFRASDDDELSQNLRVSAASLVSDRWQLGGQLTTIRRSRAGFEKTGLADTALTLGFEALPIYTYSLWRPRVFSFTQLTAPTGRSIYQDATPYSLDARGRGFWALSLGLAATKAWSDIDALVSGQVTQSFSRTFSMDGQNVRVTPGLSATLAAQMGYSPNFASGLRWALGVSPQWDAAKSVAESGAQSIGSEQLVWAASTSLSYTVQSHYVIMASYTDQTLFGPTRNAGLSRSLLIGFQKSWDR